MSEKPNVWNPNYAKRLSNFRISDNRAVRFVRFSDDSTKLKYKKKIIYKTV